MKPKHDPQSASIPSARERLLSAARGCLLDRGCQASSVKVIAEAAGVNHGLVHHYFGSKEALWVEVVRREAERIRGLVPHASDHFVDGFYRTSILEDPLQARLAIEFLSLANAFPAVRAALRDHFRATRGLLRERLGARTESSAALVFGALFGLAIQRSLDPDLPADAAARELLTLLNRAEVRQDGSSGEFQTPLPNTEPD